MKKKKVNLLMFSFITASILMSAALYDPTPILVWESTSHNFGQVKINEPAKHTFHFKNTGDAPLIIQSVKASCGCTVADYTREPIAVNDFGFVSAKYNAAKTGMFSKTVTVMANTKTQEPIVLTLTGEVIE